MHRTHFDFSAMADKNDSAAKASLESWRKYFGSAKCGIFELIEAAIMVAAADQSNEFKDRRDGIAEKLFAPPRNNNTLSSVSSEFHSTIVINGVVEKASQAKTGDDVDAKKEVLAIKEMILRNHSESVLCECLRRLTMLPLLSVEILRTTQIGRDVNGLRKHKNEQIQHLARSLVDKWRRLADEWVAKGCASSLDEQSPESVNEQSRVPPEKQDSYAALKLIEKITEQNDERALHMKKLEETKKRLRDGYQREENAKKQRTIQILQLSELPKKPKKLPARPTNRKPIRSRFGKL